MDFLNKLKDKKNPGMSPAYKAAKMSTLGSLRDEMSGMMKDDLTNAKGLKKVEVAGSSPEALSSGLDTAKSMIEGSPGEEAGETGAEEGAETDTAAGLIQELVEHEASEGDLTPDGIDAIIKMLEQKKMEMSHGSSEMTPALGKMTGQTEGKI